MCHVIERVKGLAAMISKRSIGLSVLWWILAAMEVGAFSAAPSLATKTDHGFVFTSLGHGVHFAVTAAITAGLTMLFFRKAERGPARALEFAVLLVLVGLGLEAAITVPAFIHDYAAFFGRWTVWATYGLTMLVATAVGLMQPAPKKELTTSIA